MESFSQAKAFSCLSKRALTDRRGQEGALPLGSGSTKSRAVSRPALRGAVAGLGLGFAGDGFPLWPSRRPSPAGSLVGWWRVNSLPVLWHCGALSPCFPCVWDSAWARSFFRTFGLKPSRAAPCCWERYCLRTPQPVERANRGASAEGKAYVCGFSVGRTSFSRHDNLGARDVELFWWLPLTGALEVPSCWCRIQSGASAGSGLTWHAYWFLTLYSTLYYYYYISPL